jgi:hypothetical protein
MTFSLPAGREMVSFKRFVVPASFVGRVIFAAPPLSARTDVVASTVVGVPEHVPAPL